MHLRQTTTNTTMTNAFYVAAAPTKKKYGLWITIYELLHLPAASTPVD